MFVNRGDNGDAHDNNAIITEILQAPRRARQAARLPDARALAPRERDGQDARARDGADGGGLEAGGRARARRSRRHAGASPTRKARSIKIEPWDYRYYAEKVRKAKYDLDQNEVKPYLQLDKLREGMFWVAGELFGFTFTPVTDVPVYHPDVRVWEVNDKTSGKHVGLWYFDPYARAGQALGRVDERLPHAGALRRRGHDDRLEQLELREGQAGRAGADLLGRRDDAVPRVRPRAARPDLERHLSRRSRARAVARDYVEFPSQLLEHWLSTPEVLNQFALHYQTGKPIPQALVDQDRARPSTFNQGFATVEYLASALDRHEAAPRRRRRRSTPTRSSARRWPSSACRSEIVMRHRTPQFSHVFASDGYSAGYYSYLWSDTLTADAWRGVHRGGRPLRQGGGQAAARQRLLGRQHRRSGRGLPRLPRPRSGHRRPDAQARLPGHARSQRPASKSRRARSECVRGRSRARSRSRSRPACAAGLVPLKFADLRLDFAELVRRRHVVAPLRSQRPYQ